MSIGDVDGDGEYEYIVKWDPSNSHDVSIKGYTGKCYLDCMKLDGTLLWRLDMGVNIRAGAIIPSLWSMISTVTGKRKWR